MLNKQQLHGYQLKAVNHIIDKKKCALWLEMGLGKSVSTLTAIDYLMFDEFSIHKVLIVAPLRVANTVWHKEAEKWEHLHRFRFSICTGSEAERLARLQRDADIYIINRENIPWLVEKMGKKWNFDMVVIDESSSFKSPSSKRFKALKKVLPFTERIVELTGTPAPNGYMDLYAQIFLLDSGQRLGRTLTMFRDRYFDRDYMGYNYTLRTGAVERIQNAIQDLILSMSAEDYLEMPDFIPTVINQPLEGKLLKDYKAFEKQMIMDVNKETQVTAMSAATLSNKLLQFCSGAVYNDNGQVQIIHDHKIEMLRELIEENPNDNILIAYNYKHELERILSAFPTAVVLDKQGSQVDDWNAKRIKILVAHPASAGHGLNIQHGGSVICWFGFNWSLELYQQFNARLYRQGQKNHVRAFHLSVGQIEERLMNALVSKDVTQKTLLEALKAQTKEE